MRSKVPLLTLIALLSIGTMTACNSDSQFSIKISPWLTFTLDTGKTQADDLLQRGFQQIQSRQFKAALETLQQALQIYQEIGDRAGEGSALGYLGTAYLYLGQSQKAIEFTSQRNRTWYSGT